MLFFFYFIFKLYIIVLVLPNIKMNPPQVYMWIDAFELWCWRRLLGVPWTLRRSNQPILKEINPEYSLEGLMLKMKLPQYLATWCEEPTHWKRLWCWERLRAGREEGNRGCDGWMASLTQWKWVKLNESNKLQEIVKNREVWNIAVHGIHKESALT